MRTSQTRVALLYAAAALLAGALLAAALPPPSRAADASANTGGLIVGALVVALLVALATALWMSRRIDRLNDALQAFEHGDDAQTLRLSDGDPLARLAARLETLGARITQQRGAQQRLQRQRHELLANVSHDLRTPLAAMQGYLDLLLLRRGAIDEAEQRNYLETAARHCEELGRLVGELFDLMRFDAGEIAPDMEAFALGELAHDVAQKFTRDASQRQVTLQMNTESAGAIRVHADIAMVQRALEALFDHALRRSPPGGSVTLNLGADADRAFVTVHDTGPGITAEDLPHLFSRYDRAERVIAAGRPGHGGLGLAIARRIVQLHGGELSASSAPPRRRAAALRTALGRRLPRPRAGGPGDMLTRSLT